MLHAASEANKVGKQQAHTCLAEPPGTTSVLGLGLCQLLFNAVQNRQLTGRVDIHNTHTMPNGEAQIVSVQQTLQFTTRSIGYQLPSTGHGHAGTFSSPA